VVTRDANFLFMSTQINLQRVFQMSGDVHPTHALSPARHWCFNCRRFNWKRYDKRTKYCKAVI